MARSIFAMLNRRFGDPVAGGELRRRAAQHLESARGATAVDFSDASRLGRVKPKLAIVGAGFAGCAAAHLTKTDLDVRIFDPLGRAGGRVWSSLPSDTRPVVPGRVVERGAELIGLNHPQWVISAAELGLGLTVVTPEDLQGGGLAESRVKLKGSLYDAEKLYEELKPVYQRWSNVADAAKINPQAPWTAEGAAALDSKSLADILLEEARVWKTPEHVCQAIKLEFELNNATAAENQSWLALLAQLRAGGEGLAFFEDTEIFRCAAGNDALAKRLVSGLQIEPRFVEAIDLPATGVKLTFTDGSTASFDYVIVATSVAMWKAISVNGAAFPYAAVDAGPAVKYLAPVEKRFWVPQWLSPEAVSDQLGMTWEATDNQVDTARFDLTAFAGGPLAERAISEVEKIGANAYFLPRIADLLPGVTIASGLKSAFVDWPALPTIQTGYSCPGPNQVMEQQQSYTKPYEDRLVVAGEHTSPAWFGFMEGALESGVGAVATLGKLMGLGDRPRG